MKEPSDTVDLLTLIGSAIGHLQRGIRHFDAADNPVGLSCLSTVIADIDAYLDRLADDPLVPLARVDPAKVRASLHHVQDDLTVVIEQIRQTAIP